MAVTNRHLCKTTLEQQILHLEKEEIHKPAALILREKDLTPSEYEALARKVLPICREIGVECILHSHFDVAEKLGIDKIHLPLHLWEAYPEVAASFSVVGVSVHNADEARIAQVRGASYLMAGHVFPTDCKKGVPPRGFGFLNEICEAVSVPVYAIGGISPQNLPELLQNCSALSGVCMMSYYMSLSNDKSII